MVESDMADLLKELEERARDLGAEDRARLAETLLESLHSSNSEVEKAWAQEIADRLAAYDRGEIQAHPAEEVLAEARRLLR